MFFKIVGKWTGMPFAAMTFEGALQYLRAHENEIKEAIKTTGCAQA